MQPGRRRFLMLATALVGAPIATSNSQGRVRRIGFLTPVSNPAREEAFRLEMRRLGYVEPHDVVIDFRSADGKFDRLPNLADELVSLRVDVIVAVVTQASLAAARATSTIPIVIVGVSDPVGSGLVSSLGQPYGNVTGTSSMSATVVAKQLELLHETLPGASRVSAFWNPANRVFQGQQVREARAAAKRLKLTLQLVELQSADALAGAFATIDRQRPQALLVLADPLFATVASRIAAQAIARRLPCVSLSAAQAQAGVLLTYGPNFSAMYAHAATFVDRIFKGANPAELPIEQPTVFELVINLRTAKALDITIPQSVLLRADRVIE